jgi:hypothetical protein
MMRFLCIFLIVAAALAGGFVWLHPAQTGAKIEQPFRIAGCINGQCS